VSGWIEVTRKYRFSASHRLHAAQLGEAQNRELYGKCNNPFGHGHNYEIAVTVRGRVEARSGRAVDPGLLDELVRRQVLEPFEHRNLNEEVEAFRAAVPTSENLGREVVRRLKQNWQAVFSLGGPRLERVTIAETSRNAFEVAAHEIE
jgi:6-pyruvoyltetrahydropterin/6-carboxytetrahydropterin synthase